MESEKLPGVFPSENRCNMPRISQHNINLNLEWISVISERKTSVLTIIIYMKKLLHSDWLGAVQFKRNTVAKGVTPVQITHRNSGL